MKIKREDLIIGSLAAFTCEVLYGLSYIFTKQVTADTSVLFLLGWRFLLAFVVMSLLFGFGTIKIHLKGKNLKPLLLVAIFNPIIYFIGESVGINYTTASESGAFLASILSHPFLPQLSFFEKSPHVFKYRGS